jgi:SAM-dependent methyltransferase
MTGSGEYPWQADAYGDSYADVYDEVMKDVPSEIPDMVAVLRGLNIHTLLEFGSGTGRLAIPLSGAGFSITAVEASARMLDVMQAKPGAERVRVCKGDFSEISVGSLFDGVLLSRNTLLALPTQRLQLATVRNASRHIRDGGKAFIDLGTPRPHSSPVLRYGGPMKDGLVFHHESHDAVAQRVDFTRIFIGPGSCSVVRTVSRYVWPSELDLMASLADLCLFDRWSDWTRSPYGASSDAFVSVFGKQPVALVSGTDRR